MYDGGGFAFGIHCGHHGWGEIIYRPPPGEIKQQVVDSFVFVLISVVLEPQ